jgi:hypothetical protein
MTSHQEKTHQGARMMNDMNLISDRNTKTVLRSRFIRITGENKYWRALKASSAPENLQDGWDEESFGKGIEAVYLDTQSSWVARKIASLKRPYCFIESNDEPDFETEEEMLDAFTAAIRRA